jgi:hypothetical protein
MLEHTYIVYPICLRYFGLLGSMPHCSLLILIFILSSKRAKWNCHISFYNLRDQLLPSIYPWLRNRCLAINNSSLLVSADESCTRCLAMPRLEHIYIYQFFLRYFGPLGRMPHFSLPILFLILIQSGKRGKWNYTIHRKIVMPEHTHIHTFTYIYIYRLLLLLLLLYNWLHRPLCVVVSCTNSLHIQMWFTSSSSPSGIRLVIRGRAVGFWTDMFYTMR